MRLEPHSGPAARERPPGQAAGRRCSRRAARAPTHGALAREPAERAGGGAPRLPARPYCGLEDRIAQVDDLLNAARLGPQPERLLALQRERTRLVGTLVQVRYAETLADESLLTDLTRSIRETLKSCSPRCSPLALQPVLSSRRRPRKRRRSAGAAGRARAADRSYRSGCVRAPTPNSRRSSRRPARSWRRPHTRSRSCPPQMSGTLIEQVDAVREYAVARSSACSSTDARQGARVSEVSPGGPAAEAGIRAGDVIVAHQRQRARRRRAGAPGRAHHARRQARQPP